MMEGSSEKPAAVDIKQVLSRVKEIARRCGEWSLVQNHLGQFRNRPQQGILAAMSFVVGSMKLGHKAPFRASVLTDGAVVMEWWIEKDPKKERPCKRVLVFCNDARVVLLKKDPEDRFCDAREMRPAYA